MKKLLLLEDDVNLNETVAEFLSEKGFEVIPIITVVKLAVG